MPIMTRKYAVSTVRGAIPNHGVGNVPRPTLKPTDSRPVLPSTLGSAYAAYEL